MFLFLFVAHLSAFDPTLEPVFNNSFNFLNTGIRGGIAGEDINIVPAWNKNFTGKGIHIALFDAGCQYNHSDLIDNFVLEKSWNALTNDTDPFLQSKDPTHGTATAGLAVGAANGVAHIGSAPGANFSSLTVDIDWETYGSIDLPTLLDIYHHTEYDILSCSLALEGLLRDGVIYYHQYRKVEEIEDMIEGLNRYRDGKGAILLHADGNSGSEIADVNVGIITKLRRVFAIGGSTNRGEPISYSQTGANVLVNAPSGGTVYLGEGLDMYFPEIYSAFNENLTGVVWFSGTSACSPQVAGVIALCLEANPNLTWRDVMYILILTAQINDPNNELWQRNAAGYLYHPVLGFGRVDADLALTTAQNWVNVSEEFGVVSLSSIQKRVNHACENWTEIDITVNDSIEFIEHIYLEFELNTSEAAFLHIHLISPQGTERTILEPSPVLGDHHPDDLTFQFGIRSFFGESTEGTWKIKIRYEAYITNVQISHVSLIFHGLKEKPNLPSITRRQTATNVAMPDNGKPTYDNESITVTNAICGEKMKIEVNTNRAAALPVLIVDPSTGLTTDFTYLHDDKVIEVDTPCVFKDGLELYVSARVIGEETVISTPVVFSNPKNLGINSPQKYEKIKFTDSGENPILKLMWVRNDEKPKNGGCQQMAAISVVDFDTGNVIASKRVVDLGNAEIELPKESHPRCVVTIAPVKESNVDPCAVLVQKFSLLNENDDDNVGNFDLWYPNDTECFNNNDEDDDGKDNKTGLIIGVTIACVVVVILIIVGVIFGMKKCKKDSSSSSSK
ncbi:Clan SB, family S8, subtilisin-like serine peptidase [Histomonas meleagridis]|uniref:Clan SB, family S8, subtilisin-like serine peptidase n=1 Tax=Histomonas meleagridis TaxID=135588 RepID=UPI0035596F75|nr:Clan SB, family S8, subtilisin-like serine peptidase [Histomonas meleagridis]KAH0796970.1 Clan SB, family S8, subtilisin-like serine peptidase [Histomonas meleagridis]